MTCADLAFIVALCTFCALVGSILNEDAGWRPSITIKQMLHGIFELLDNPNVSENTRIRLCVVQCAILCEVLSGLCT